jgi:hypothetical protein
MGYKGTTIDCDRPSLHLLLDFALSKRLSFDPNPSLNTPKSSKIAKVKLQIKNIMSGINKHV